jgi:chitodextrinase
MASSLTIPAIGPVDKRIVIGVGSVGLAYVGYQYFKSRSAANTATSDTSATDPGFVDAGTIPAVAGAVPSDNSFGSGSAVPASASDFGFTGTSNSEWTQYATVQLQQSDTWTYTDIVSALGNFINNKPLSTLQQQIVQAAIAVAGNPPEGNHTIIPGGNGTITIAPTGLTGKAINSTSVQLNWNAVAGADGYAIWRSGVSQPVGFANTTSGQVGGLTPGTSYSFQVSARAVSGTTGPKSSATTIKTSTSAPKPTPNVWINGLSSTTLTVEWQAVAGATSYHVYENGKLAGTTVGTWLSRKGLRKNTAYSYHVVTVGGGTTSGNSKTVTVRTKK